MITKIVIALLLATSPFSTGVEDSKIVTVQNKNIPQKNTKSLGVEVTAGSAFVIDKETGTVLFEKSKDLKRPHASITKVMTVLLALESDMPLTEEVIIPKIELEGAGMDLEEGEKISFEDIIKGAMIRSGNDAAYAIAYHVEKGDVDAFVERMNRKAVELELNNTHFANPHGLDADDHYSTAEDIARLFEYALKNESFKQYMNTAEHQAHALDREKVHTIKNTNKLLDSAYPYMIGGKTGYTDNAGFCLVSLSKKNEREIITVVLGSDLNGNQFQDSKALIEWSYNNYEWKNNTE